MSCANMQTRNMVESQCEITIRHYDSHSMLNKLMDSIWKKMDTELATITLVVLLYTVNFSIFHHSTVGAVCSEYPI